MPDRRASRRSSAQPHSRTAIVLTMPLLQSLFLASRHHDLGILDLLSDEFTQLNSMSKLGSPGPSRALHWLRYSSEVQQPPRPRPTAKDRSGRITRPVGLNDPVPRIRNETVVPDACQIARGST